MLRRMQDAVVKKMKMTQVERHWSALFAAVLVALSICRSQGLLSFDMAAMQAWMAEQLEGNRKQKTEMVATLEDQIGYMINDLWEGMLVTTGEGDRRTGVTPSIDKPPYSKLIGRAINPLLPTDLPQMYISRAAVRAWAAGKGLSAGGLFNTAVKLGWCDPDAATRYSLGKGTIQYNTGTLTVPCWRFYPLAMGGVTGQIVQQLRTVKAQGKP
jgi:hypothetical protein